MELKTDLGLEKVSEWARQLFFPTQSVINAFFESKENGASSTISKYWLTPVILTALTELSIYLILGSKLSETTLLTATYIVLTLLAPFIHGFVLFLLLRLLLVNISLDVVYSLYTIEIIYAPIISLFSMRRTIVLYGLIKDVVDRKLNFDQSVAYFIANLKSVAVNYNSGFQSLNIAFEWGATLLSIFISVLLAESLAQLAGVSRIKSYVVVAFLSVSTFLPTVVIEVLKWILVEHAG